MRDAVESLAVLRIEVDRHDVALALAALVDKELTPRYVVYLAVDEARAQSCGKQQHMAVAAEGRVHLHGKVAPLLAELVDGYAEWCQPFEVHEEVVDDVLDTSPSSLTYDGTECYAVDAAEGVVAHEDEGSPVVERHIVKTLDVKLDIEIFHCPHTEVHANAVLADVGVNELLMYEAFQPAKDERRDVLRLCPGAAANDLLYVDLFGRHVVVS